MKKLLSAFLGLALLLVVGTKVYASPTNSDKGNNNPNVVAFYYIGSHTVIQKDGTILYNQPGADLVQQTGNSNNFQQWYKDPNGGGVHTLWQNVGSATSCNGGGTLIVNPNQPPQGDTWGNYFKAGDNYCVKSNSFQNGN